MKRVVVDPGWLAEHYLEHRTPLRRIAELAGVSERTVRNKLREAGYQRRPPQKRAKEPAPPRGSRYPMLNDPDELQRRIDSGASRLGLAGEVGCDRGAVRSALVRHGITWRTQRSRWD